MGCEGCEFLGEGYVCQNDKVPPGKVERPCPHKSLGKKFDYGKLMYHLIPPEPIEHLARIYTHGCGKYGTNQWQNVRPFYERYYDALKRHLEADRMGELYDKDSGELHLAHAFWNMCTLLWGRIQDEKISEETIEKKGSVD